MFLESMWRYETQMQQAMYNVRNIAQKNSKDKVLI